jgi:hypothetical protein
MLCFAFPRRFRKNILHLGIYTCAWIALGGILGCGGNSGSSAPPAATVNKTPAGTYTLTLTATTGATTLTQPLTLVVQ